jgi:hypothetical protein
MKPTTKTPKAVNPDSMLRELHKSWVAGKRTFVAVKLAVKAALGTWAAYNTAMAKRGGLRKALTSLGAKPAKKSSSKEGVRRAA